jgi:hypothetical protein
MMPTAPSAREARDRAGHRWSTLEIEEVQAWAAGLEVVHARIAGRFGRAEPRRRVLAYLRGLLGAVTRKNG